MACGLHYRLRCMHLALACTARARWGAQFELSPRLAAADSARVGEAGLVGRELTARAWSQRRGRRAGSEGDADGIDYIVVGT